MSPEDRTRIADEDAAFEVLQFTLPVSRVVQGFVADLDKLHTEAGTKAVGAISCAVPPACSACMEPSLVPVELRSASGAKPPPYSNLLAVAFAPNSVLAPSSDARSP